MGTSFSRLEPSPRGPRQPGQFSALEAMTGRFAICICWAGFFVGSAASFVAQINITADARDERKRARHRRRAEKGLIEDLPGRDLAGWWSVGGTLWRDDYGIIAIR